MKRLHVMAFVLVLLTAACALEGSSARNSEPALGTSGSSPGPSEGPAAPGAVAFAASELARALADDARFASAEVLEGDRVVVHWEGPVDSKLQDLLSRFHNVDISVNSASCSPGKLREYARRLLAEDPAVNIVSTSPDGSGLQITLEESLRTRSDISSLKRKYFEGSGCPVRLQFGDVASVSG